MGMLQGPNVARIMKLTGVNGKPVNNLSYGENPGVITDGLGFLINPFETVPLGYANDHKSYIWDHQLRGLGDNGLSNVNPTYPLADGD